MNYPQELLYTKDHEWIRFDGKDAYIGITDFAQKELGDIVYLDISTLNEVVNSEQVFGTVEAVKTVSDLLMPVSGDVLEVNPKLTTNPELVNKDPYGDGWMVKIKISDASQLSDLMDAGAYQSTVGA